MTNPLQSSGPSAKFQYKNIHTVGVIGLIFVLIVIFTGIAAIVFQQSIKDIVGGLFMIFIVAPFITTLVMIASWVVLMFKLIQAEFLALSQTGNGKKLHGLIQKE